MGSATVQGQLWGTGPHDWAEVIEPLLYPIHLATAEALAPLSGLSLLDAGCGTGLALRLAAARGARVSGLDASAALLDVARGQLPDADLRVGDIEELPYDDATFDVVTASNSIQYAGPVFGGPAAAGHPGRRRAAGTGRVRRGTRVLPAAGRLVPAAERLQVRDRPQAWLTRRSPLAHSAILAR
jgi:SAM-dependent methyltransferase